MLCSGHTSPIRVSNTRNCSKRTVPYRIDDLLELPMTSDRPEIAMPTCFASAGAVVCELLMAASIGTLSWYRRDVSLMLAWRDPHEQNDRHDDIEE